MLSREELGKIVRAEWIRWAEQQPDAKPGWLLPWDDMTERDREADRRIGEAVADALQQEEQRQRLGPEGSPWMGAGFFATATHPACSALIVPPETKGWRVVIKDGGMVGEVETGDYEMAAIVARQQLAAFEQKYHLEKQQAGEGSE